ncbi:AzlD domain-containing protein [Nocardioides sp. GY 10113]|uniref:AzlD domain-containing protein n=1 Tax=Nocardioides sp. GY 10113 TaxID=2569761 RepID=UPI00198036D8|nr:AzlD domain-containing protein [Nocardioides sp. GY 10113]
MIWWAVIVGSIGCYLLKLAGLAVPESVLARPWVARVVDLIPVALLAALVAVQVLSAPDPSGGQQLSFDARVAGLGAAVVLLVLRAPFLVVVVGSALVAAGLRAIVA